MHFEERVRTNASQARAWDFLWQAKRLAGCLPGCTGVDEIAPGKKYKVQFEDRLGPYKVHFDMEIEVEETRVGEYVRLRGTGHDKALGASQQLTLAVTLQRLGDHETDLLVVADVEVLGKVATLGQFVIKRKAKDIVTRFAQNIDIELRREAEAGAAPA